METIEKVLRFYGLILFTYLNFQRSHGIRFNVSSAHITTVRCHYLDQGTTYVLIGRLSTTFFTSPPMLHLCIFSKIGIPISGSHPANSSLILYIKTVANRSFVTVSAP